MNDNKDVVCSNPDEINLFDIWKKLVQYKKVFWTVFLTVFALSAVAVFLTPKKNNFSMIIETSKSLNEKGDNVINISMVDSILKIKKVFYPKAIRAYNAKTETKGGLAKDRLLVEKVGGNSILLSIDGSITEGDKYQFILNQIVEDFADDTEDFIKYRKETLNNLKNSLERRLVEANNFYGAMVEKGFGIDSGNPNNISTVESRVVSMYLNDQNAVMIQLTNNINAIQSQIIGTQNAKAISEVIVSDTPVGISKVGLMLLALMASLFCAFFSVFICNFFSCLKRTK